MMRIISIIFISFCWLLPNAIAQSVSDTISITTGFVEYDFVINGQPVSTNEVSALMESNFDAYDSFESGREAKVFGYVFFTIGSGLVVYPFITAILGKETNWAMTYAGMGFVGLSIPIFHNYHKKTENAIKMYNDGLMLPDLKPDNQGSLNFQFSGSAIGLAYRF